MAPKLPDGGPPAPRRAPAALTGPNRPRGTKALCAGAITCAPGTAGRPGDTEPTRFPAQGASPPAAPPMRFQRRVSSAAPPPVCPPGLRSAGPASVAHGPSSPRRRPLADLGARHGGGDGALGRGAHWQRSLRGRTTTERRGGAHARSPANTAAARWRHGAGPGHAPRSPVLAGGSPARGGPRPRRAGSAVPRFLPSRPVPSRPVPSRPRAGPPPLLGPGALSAPCRPRLSRPGRPAEAAGPWEVFLLAVHSLDRAPQARPPQCPVLGPLHSGLTRTEVGRAASPAPSAGAGWSPGKLCALSPPDMPFKASRC